MDGVGTVATFASPIGIAAYGAGIAFVSDYDNSLIRRLVLSSGAVTTFVGAAASGRVDGVGTQARFRNPYGLTYVAASDSLFVTDSGNHLVRRIIVATANVSTFAGGASAGSANGVGTAATFNLPNGITSDGAGNLYVVDQLNHRVRVISIANASVSTLAGSTSGSADGTGTSAKFSSPVGIYFFSGSLYVADALNNRIRQVVITTGAVTVLAGGANSGLADATGTAAQFFTPMDVTGDGAGNLYIADRDNDCIRKIEIATRVVSSMAGGTNGFTDGWNFNVQFNSPRGVCMINGTVYVADTANNVIRKMT